VSKTQNKGLYSLIKAFMDQTGCPMILNTSLNIRGKPMVNTREDADAFEKEYGITVVS
jgi:carbamoyltransferase